MNLLLCSHIGHHVASFDSPSRLLSSRRRRRGSKAHDEADPVPELPPQKARQSEAVHAVYDWWVATHYLQISALRLLTRANPAPYLTILCVLSCLTATGETNEHRYVVATADTTLIHELEQRPGIPILTINHSKLSLRRPTPASLAAAEAVRWFADNCLCATLLDRNYCSVCQSHPIVSLYFTRSSTPNFRSGRTSKRY